MAGWHEKDPREWREVPLSALVISREYQREGPPRLWVETVLNEFDFVRSEAVTAVDNGDGTYHVVEGQGRTLVAKEAVEKGLAPAELALKVLVIPHMETGARAALVRDISGPGGRRRYDEIALWRADVAAGDKPNIVAVNDALAELGVAVAAGSIRSTTAVRRMAVGARTPQEAHDVVVEVVSIPLEAWEPDASGRLDGRLLTAVYDVLRNGNLRTRKDVNRARLVETLALLTPERWLRRARANPEPGLSVRMSMYNEVVREYNRHLKPPARLPFKSGDLAGGLNA